MAHRQVRRRVLHALVTLITLASFGGAAHAEKLPLGFRASFQGAVMVSKDQLLKLGYDQYGGLFDLHITYQPLRWLDLGLGMVAGLFPASHGYPPGGLVAPLAGALMHAPSRRISPFVRAELGPGFTGDYVRTTIRVSAGVDIGIRRGVMMGPVFGFTQVFQKSGPYYSEDAKFVWFGLSLSYRPEPPPPRRPVHVTTIQQIHEHHHHHNQPASTTVVNQQDHVDQGELLELIESALPSPSERVELLAPVLFATDSDTLEPLGVAMLHEVARLLGERPELTKVAIEGYADRRGSPEHNRALAQRRAERVREWLISHGVAETRLTIRAEGARDFVEQGRDDAAHLQNRRVIFRVLEIDDALKAKPMSQPRNQ